MPSKPHVLTLRIELAHIRPPIWRRIEIPATATFWDLHVAIQDAVGWDDSHLHVFRIADPIPRARAEIGIPDPEAESWRHPVMPGWKVRVTAYLTQAGSRARYEYDFGDGWDHEVLLEKVGPRKPRTKYPRCLDGARACPPEDCGGPPGYAELLRVIANPRDPEHRAMLDWLGGDFDPEEFAAGEVSFSDPRERWEEMFGRSDEE